MPLVESLVTTPLPEFGEQVTGHKRRNTRLPMEAPASAFGSYYHQRAKHDVSAGSWFDTGVRG